MLVEFYERFKMLESNNDLDPNDPSDLFCLHFIFLPAIQSKMDRHYMSLRMQKKRRSTLNPAYPRGTHRRSHIYEMYPSCGRPVSEADIVRLRDMAVAFWMQTNPASLLSRPWEIDPVVTVSGRAKRARFMGRRVSATLEEAYKHVRWCTRDLASRGQ